MTRILIIEDEGSYREALTYMLGKEGFDVATAADGESGLTEYDRNGADLVLLDLMLPGMPGTEVCRRLRARGDVAIIMVSARDSETDKVVGLEIGADDYVTKPFSHRELVARIRAILRRGHDSTLIPEVVEMDGGAHRRGTPPGSRRRTGGEVGASRVRAAGAAAAQRGACHDPRPDHRPHLIF